MFWPLEAAAEAAGVDPARLYTVEELEQAFLAGCDAGRLAGFDPLFEGGEKIQAAPRWPPGPRCCPICSCRPLSAGR